MKKAVEQLYNDKYRREPAEEDKGVSQPEKSFLTSYLDGAVPDTIKDEWRYYLTGQQTRIKPGKLYSWWNEQTSIPAVRQMAFDLLSIPAMSAETERESSATLSSRSHRREPAWAPTLWRPRNANEHG
jgi:hypothetical protein